MGTRLLLVLLFLGGLSPAAFAHRVPWDENDPAFDLLRDNQQSELAYQLARYCYLLGRDPAVCVSTLKAKGLKAVAAAAVCTSKWTEHDPDLQAIMHQVGNETPNMDCSKGGSSCFWHQSFVNDKRKDSWGNHRHEYTVSQRQFIAMEYAFVFLSTYIKNYSGSTTEDLQKAGSATTGTMGMKTGGLLAAAAGEANIGITHGVTQGGESKQTQQGPTTEQRNQQFDRGYRMAYDAPHKVSNAAPEALCVAGKPLCIWPGSADYPNTGRREPPKLPTTLITPDTLPTIDRPTPTPPTPTPPTPTPPPPPEPQAASPSSGCTQVQVCIDDDYFPYGIDQMVTENDPAAIAMALDACVDRVVAPNPTIEVTEHEPTEDLTLREQAEKRLSEGECMRSWYGDAYCDLWYAVPEKITAKEDLEKFPLFNNKDTTFTYDEPSEKQSREEYCEWLKQQAEGEDEKVRKLNMVPSGPNLWDQYYTECASLY